MNAHYAAGERSIVLWGVAAAVLFILILIDLFTLPQHPPF